MRRLSLTLSFTIPLRFSAIFLNNHIEIGYEDQRTTGRATAEDVFRTCRSIVRHLMRSRLIKFLDHKWSR